MKPLCADARTEHLCLLTLECTPAKVATHHHANIIRHLIFTSAASGSTAHLESHLRLQPLNLQMNSSETMFYAPCDARLHPKVSVAASSGMHPKRS